MIDLTPLLRGYAKYRMARLCALDPVQTQEQQLKQLLKTAAATRFGRDHGFTQIKNVAQFQKQVPLRKYEDFWDGYWKESFPNFHDCSWPGLIPFIPVSSGTTSGTTKYIPCSRQMVRSNSRAGLDLLVYHVTNRPHSKIFGGKSFFLGGSADLVKQAPGVWSGDLSGIVVKTLPWWARPRYFPPLELALISDWEKKIEILGRESLRQDIRTLSGVPAWMLILVKKLSELKPGTDGKLHSLYPNLELLVHGGVNFAPYLKQFQDLLEGSHAELREVYPASEGFIAIADRGYGEGLRLNLDGGLFYEFVPLEELGAPNPTRHWVADIQPDLNYAVIVTTCAGLWSYVLGDTVKFVETKVPRLLVTGRTSYYLSAFGEHLIAEEIEESISEAAREIGSAVSDYSVGPIFPQHAGELGGHLYVIEFAKNMPNAPALDSFKNKLDRRLCERNEDYAAHRSKGFGLNPPQLAVVPSGTFAAWMKSRGKLGGQHKVPRIINDREILSNLRDFARQSGAILA
ncbi:MAG: GH3 auxin-responsive promoter family protein [Oligoflexia bacterium]|nr:GH3 auxin-responsive promoter family protein [Oligoflexia bacterium]